MMYGLTTIKRLNRRAAGAVFALAMLLFLAGTFTQAQAQLKSFNAFDANFRGGVSVGAAAGQTINILIQAADAAGTSSNKPAGDSDIIVGSGFSGAHVKVFNGATGALLWSRTITSLTPGLHIFAVNRDELPQVSNSDGGRVQLWIDVVMVRCQPRGEPTCVNVLAPTFEIFDNQSGRTNANGGVWKTTNFLTTDPLRSRPIVFTGLE